jgi:hypothetical protein
MYNRLAGPALKVAENCPWSYPSGAMPLPFHSATLRVDTDTPRAAEVFVMYCRIYSAQGSLVHGGPCGVRPDGAIEVVVERRRDGLQQGRGPLVMEEGPRRYQVHVTDRHPPKNPALNDFVVYHLTPVEDDRRAAVGPGASRQ